MSSMAARLACGAALLLSADAFTSPAAFSSGRPLLVPVALRAFVLPGARALLHAQHHSSVEYRNIEMRPRGLLHIATLV